MRQLPVGQVYKDFAFPYFQNGQMAYTLSAREAKGITLNKAEAIDLKIEVYDQGKVTTTITSPSADLYIADRKMRTKNTVQIERTDSSMAASGQTCDFDLSTKKYLLRGNVKVTLKNFDSDLTPRSPAALAAPTTLPVAPAPVPGDTSHATVPPLSFDSTPTPNTNSAGDTSGTYTPTNAAPIAPPVTP
jgi:hypothetical protein